MAGRIWTNDEDRVMHRFYADCSPERLMDLLPGRSVRAIHSRAKILGLKKSKGYMRRLAKQSDLATVGASTRFKKGHPPFNKGKKYQPGGRSVETRFKPGHKPENTKPLGYESVRQVKGRPYRYVKTENGMEPLHRVIAEQHYGKLPPGTVIRFKDRNTLNCDIENFEVINQKQNMLRNSLVNYPDWLRAIIHQRAVLTRKINQYGKKQDAQPA